MPLKESECIIRERKAAEAARQKRKKEEAKARKKAEKTREKEWQKVQKAENHRLQQKAQELGIGPLLKEARDLLTEGSSYLNKHNLRVEVSEDGGEARIIRRAPGGTQFCGRDLGYHTVSEHDIEEFSLELGTMGNPGTPIVVRVKKRGGYGEIIHDPTTEKLEDLVDQFVAEEIS